MVKGRIPPTTTLRPPVMSISFLSSCKGFDTLGAKRTNEMSRPRVANTVARDERETRPAAIPTSSALKNRRAARDQNRRPSPELEIEDRKTHIPCRATVADSAVVTASGSTRENNRARIVTRFQIG